MAERKGYLVPVELKFINDEIGHGVFASEFIPRGTELWIPTLVKKLTCFELAEELSRLSPEKAHEFLRQGFVLSSDLEHFCVNPEDLGRFTNHSSDPNSGYADFSEAQTEVSIALRDIQKGEEITCDYRGLGSPLWYKDLCSKYKVIPTDEVTSL